MQAQCRSRPSVAAGPVWQKAQCRSWPSVAPGPMWQKAQCHIDRESCINSHSPTDGEPCRTGVALTDLSCGLYATGAIMAAMLYRQKTGLGQHIDCNLLNTQIASLTHIASNYLNCGVEGKRYGTGHPSVAPLQAFNTKDDGYMMIAATNDKAYAELCKRIGLPEMASDKRYSTNALRVENRKSMISTMVDRFAEKTVSEWMELLENASFPYGPVNNIQQAFGDPQVLHNKMIQEIEHPTEGTLRVPGPAVRYSEFDTVLQMAPPLLGQHTDEVLSSLLEYDDDKIKQLKDNGYVA
ncbi:Succinate--hydroxymethylglutarate CoA-transferase [Lamellibrachia satsuma]|nr:Succinate--hydroxymethylglutarate CoA-transferase [Lamellibrachia satsuma]